MAAFNLDALLRQLHQLAVPHEATGSSDRELVNRVVTWRDEAAFELIVWRHGPMVFRVCRRLLGNEHDAEDAFQATFLTLARKASSISRRQALASWLYKVAFRVALRAQEMAARRANVEKHLATDLLAPCTEEATSLEWRDLLDAELDRLPERYRVPVVLCYLQGRTTEEAARELGCPRGTVLSRLARARERLRKRFLRCGVALPAGILVAALSEGKAPALIPARLVSAAVRTGLASGSATVAASVAALCTGVLRSMFLKRLRFISAIAAAVVVVAGAGIVTRQALAGRPSLAAPEAKAILTAHEASRAPAGPSKEETHPITVTGTALSAQGKPIKASTIYLLSTNRRNLVLGTTRSDHDGHYAFKDALLPLDRPSAPEGWLSGTFQVYGTVPEFGFAWHGMRFFHARTRPTNWNPSGEDYSYFLGEPLVMNLEFQPAAKLHGRLVDESGTPVKGAKVLLQSADYLDVRNREEHMNFREFWGIKQAEAKLISAMSDDAGGFQLSGLPREVCFWVWVEHPSYATFTFYAVTTDRQVTERNYGRQKQIVHTSPLDLKLLKPRRVMLQVVYDDAGKPAPDIRIGTSGAGAEAVGYFAGGATDTQGRLLLKLPPGDYPLVADPKGDLPYIRTQKVLTVSKTPEEQTSRLRMNPGCVLTLRVVDEATEKGIAHIRFGCEAENASGHWMSVSGDTGRVGDPYSDANGQVRIVLAPGKRNFKVGMPPLPAEYEVVPSGEDLREPGTRAVELLSGGTVTVTFKLRKK